MRGKKKASTEPTAVQTPTPTTRRPPYDDGRGGGWLGPPPNHPSWNDWEYQQWIKDTDR